MGAGEPRGELHASLGGGHRVDRALLCHPGQRQHQPSAGPLRIHGETPFRRLGRLVVSIELVETLGYRHERSCVGGGALVTVEYGQGVIGAVDVEQVLGPGDDGVEVIGHRRWLDRYSSSSS